ncbi:putative bifunctional diguanylate cyclase/phosphodiesterase [Sulfuriferula nivalis]|uniref:Bifunctional diguanylate cyclase/phosphodiesterase n=1 Tax=Sulfuriferula nivalis TaxID=2675298 RepID=A0A809S8U5_9PROT|nr:EAL domain-containing protein [Sulfuriferula nivalis]BBP00462.1 bifunctional diguanylate cyclase/phosphodiesterase [Sulfuriferula nivalis]
MIELPDANFQSDLTREELSLLLNLGERLNSELDPNNILSLVAELACKIIGAETLALPMVDLDEKTYTYRAAYGKHAELLQEKTFPTFDGACGWVIKHQRPLLFGAGGDFEMRMDAHWLPGQASSLLVPLMCRGAIIGGLSAMGKIGNVPFDQHDQTMLTLIANQAGIAIDNARLFQKLSLEESRLRLVLDSAGEAIYGVDLDGLCIFANPSCLRLLGYERQEDLAGKLMHNLIHHTYPDGRPFPVAECKVRLSVRNGEYVHVENELHWRADGTAFPVEYWSRPIYRDGKLDGAVVTFIDITERKLTEEKILRLAYFDPLTNLPNRRLLMDRFKQALIASDRSKELGALIILDLDNFKTINDTLGHDIGDQLLILVAQRILDNIRQEDTVSRLGGDEYVVMLENMGTDPITASNQAEMIAEKIRNALALPYMLSDKLQAHYSTCSFGITLFQGHKVPIETLFKQADVALYQAKDAGRNAIRFFSPEMQAAIDSRSEMETTMRNGLLHNEFQLFYQPQIDIDGEIIGAEALLRWFPRDQESVLPIQFIPVAEEVGLIIPLGLWVMETACAQLKAWENDPRTRHLKIAVNVSARQLRQLEFVKQVQDALEFSGANPSLLKLELTESVLLEDVDDIVERMQQIKLFGVTFSLDDFGTGFSSLSYLKRLPLDQVKIDQSFVRDIHTDPNDAAIVRAIIAMSHSLGLKVIAEGVETKSQLNFLKNYGCAHFQGYLFGKPMPIEEFEKLLKRI